MKFNRIWSMPSKDTFSIKPISSLLRERIKDNEKWADPYSGDSAIKKVISNIDCITNDLNPSYNTTYHLLALDFLRILSDNVFDGILYDPPYSVRQVSECYKNFGKEVTNEVTRSDYWTKEKNEISRVLKVGGVCISFGWNSNGIGKGLGFEIEEILLVPHGGIHNDTIVVVERKL